MLCCAKPYSVGEKRKLKIPGNSSAHNKDCCCNCNVRHLRPMLCCSISSLELLHVCPGVPCLAYTRLMQSACSVSGIWRARLATNNPRYCYSRWIVPLILTLEQFHCHIEVHFVLLSQPVLPIPRLGALPKVIHVAFHRLRHPLSLLLVQAVQVLSLKLS